MDLHISRFLNKCSSFVLQEANLLNYNLEESEYFCTILQAFSKTPVVCPYYSNEKICFAECIDQVLRQELPDNYKYEYPFIQDYLSKSPCPIQTIWFYQENFSSSGNVYFTQMKQLDLNEIFQEMGSTLLIGDQYNSCNVFWRDYLYREQQLFVNKFDQSNMFSLFKFKNNVFFMPLGNFLYPLQKDRNEILKLGVHDVIGLTEEMFVQVDNLMIPQQNVPPADLMSTQRLHLNQYLVDVSQIHLKFPELCRIPNLEIPQITLQLWSMDLEKKRITKHGEPKDFNFSQEERKYRFGGTYQKELKFAPGVGDYELDIVYEIDKDVHVKRSIYGISTISVKMHEIETQIECFLPKLHLLHKEIKFTQKGLSSSRKHQIEFRAND